MDFKIVKDQISHYFRLCAKYNIKLPRSFYLDDEKTLKDIDQIDKDLVIIEFISIMKRIKPKEDLDFFEKILDYFDINNDNIKVLRYMFTYISMIESKNYFNKFFLRYQNYIANDILFVCDKILNSI